MAQVSVMVSNFGMLGREVQKRVTGVVHATSGAILAGSLNRMSGPKSGRFLCCARAGRHAEAKCRREERRCALWSWPDATDWKGWRGGIVCGRHSHLPRFGLKVKRQRVPPANLAASGHVVAVAPLTDAVEFNAAQALALELGRSDGSIAARPFVRPEVQAQTAGFENGIASAMNGAASSFEVKADG